jgi:hypothetical protein
MTHFSVVLGRDGLIADCHPHAEPGIGAGVAVCSVMSNGDSFSIGD